MLSSNPASTAPPPVAPSTSTPPRTRVIVLEGMPGAGKTTAAEALAKDGRMVVGEYVDDHGTTVPVSQHPGVSDDDAHQSNWLAKHQQVTATRNCPVFVDRDWVSALAYAHSLPADTSTPLLTARARWIAGHLLAGRLAVADTYVLFHLDVRSSLRRRVTRLTAGHPWSHRPGLARLRRFYRDPAAAIEPVHPPLAAAMRSATWRHVAGLSIEQTLRLLRDTADRP